MTRVGERTTMITPEIDRIYLVELCSGERRRWRYGGADAWGQAWWFDLETGREFGENSLMYSWQLVGEEVAKARK